MAGIGVRLVGDHFFHFTVAQPEGTYTVSASAGELREEAEFIHVSQPDPAYRFQQGTVLNWFDIDTPDGFYSVKDLLKDIVLSPEAAALVNERFAGIVQAYVNLASIDVVPAGCSKGTGLRMAAEHYGATLTAGIGDSYNDLELLKAADVAYTFHSSPAEMHADADVLVDAAAEAIRDFMTR